jgi:hypothetical protein
LIFVLVFIVVSELVVLYRQVLHLIGPALILVLIFIARSLPAAGDATAAVGTGLDLGLGLHRRLLVVEAELPDAGAHTGFDLGLDLHGCVFVPWGPALIFVLIFIG